MQVLPLADEVLGRMTILDFNGAPPPIDPAERLDKIKSALNAKAISFVRYLFPAASIRRGEARVGNMQGHPGESLWIGLQGAKAGQWRDHATDEQGGDLIGLYAAAMGATARSDFPMVLDELEAWLGWRKADVPVRPQQLAREARKDDPKPQDEPLGAPTGTWHYLDDHSNIIATVWRYDFANGSKTYRPWDAKVGKHAMPEIRPLYNLPGVQFAEPVILVEGEKCADALIGLGYCATTAMGGANAPLDRTDWTGLKNKRVIIWPDADIAGEKYVRAAVPYLTALGCQVSVVVPPEGVPKGWDAADAVRDGVDVAPLIKAAVEPEKPSRFTFMSLGELMMMEPPAWILDGILIETGLATVFGAPANGKSFIVLDWTLCLAHGVPWLNRSVQQRGVVYIAGEGAGGLGKRVQAWHQARGLSASGVPFHVLPTAVNMLDGKADVPQLVQAIQALGSVGVVVIDTLARSFVGGDENDAKDMGMFIANCGRLREALGGLVIAVHHSGKDKEKGSRGSTTLPAAVDTEVVVEKTEGLPNLTMRIRKQKDGEDGLTIPLRLQRVEVVHPVTGEVSTSCVIMPDEPTVRRQKLGPTQQAILDTLQQLGPMTRSEIETATDKTRKAVLNSLFTMCQMGLIVKEGGSGGGPDLNPIYSVKENQSSRGVTA